MTRDNTPGETAAVPWINPDSTEGAAIIDLLRRLKEIEHAHGSWPGGDVVHALDVWLSNIGLHPEDDPDDAMRHLRTRPRAWTVFGLHDTGDDGDTLIAAVVAGDIPTSDTDPGSEGDYQRVAESVIATDANEAARTAYEMFEAGRDA